MSRLIIISGPSGSGQDTVIEAVQKHLPIERVITSTTRPMRPGESQGKPYYFLSHEVFEKGVATGKFFEHAKHYNGEWYGVTFDEIERVRHSPRLGVWKMDYQGVLSAKKILPDIPAILLTAPLDVLEARIRGRGNVTDEFVRERMEYTKGYFDHADAYDFQVENAQGKLQDTIQKILQIIQQVTGVVS